MLKRQRFLLALLDRAGGSATRTWLARAAFLASRDRAGWTASPLYDFVPHADGPRSFSLDRELETLERDGFIVDEKKTLALTPAGRAECVSIDPTHASALRGAWHRYGLADDSSLPARIARDFAWYANVESAARKPAPPAIYTVGYRELSIDAFLDGLLRRGVGRIVDVRANPASRRLGFHKSTLRRLAADVGVAYEHFPQLGIAKELRADAASADDYNRLFEDYAVRVRMQDADLDAVVALLAERASVLVCAEPEAKDCHRSRLATALAERSSLAVEHLDLRT
jgi:hypothetical protein